MKKIRLFFFLLILSPVFSFGLDITEVEDFGSNPGNLRMYYYKPKNLPDSVKAPVVFVLHGCLQNAENVAELSGWNKLADLNGFYVVYPQQKYTNNSTGCFNWFRKKDITKGSGEVHSIKQMMDYSNKNFGTDSTRVFVAGLSAGAAMAVALMADYPESIDAGAIFAGGPYMAARNGFEGMFVLWLPPNKSPKKWAKRVYKQNPDYKGKYPRLVVFHGRTDFVVNIRNSWELIQQWSYLHHTDPKYDEKKDDFAGAQGITRLAYKDEKNEEVIIFYKIKKMGHALALDPGNSEDQGGKTGMFAKDKNFHSTYWAAYDFGLIK